jgi:multicomponent Na+:H+ antiporter subunit B
MKMLSDFFDIAAKLDFEFGVYLLIVVITMLSVVAAKLAVSQMLLDNVILLSVFSVLISICYLLMDAPDVAMTEVALGSCLSSCVLLNFLKLLKTSNATERNKTLTTLTICTLFFVSLIYISSFLPEYGNRDATLHGHISKYYIENTKSEIGITSFAAAILASYRGYDTLGETSVILIAGLAILLILSTNINDKRTK